MNERAYARREAMRNNRSERNISRRRITQRDFINQSHGSILCSGVDAALLGDTLIPELVAGYPNDGRTTIMLTASPHRMQVIHELVSRGMPAIYFDNTNRNYHAMYRQSAESIRRQVHDAASGMMSAGALDDLMRFLSAIIALTGHYYPLSLPSISALLQMQHAEIIELARQTHLSDDLIDIIQRSSDTCQDLRDVLYSLEYAMSGISDPETESGISLLTAVQRGIPMVVLFQMGFDQTALNHSLADDLRNVIYTNHRIRVVIDSVTFGGPEDPLLTLLMSCMHSGLLDLVVISPSAASMLQDDRNIYYFPNVFLSVHGTAADTERHTAVFGDYMHSQENLTVSRRPFHIYQNRQYAISNTNRLRIRTEDLLPARRFLSEPITNIACQLGQTLYLVDRNFFFRQQGGIYE